MELDHFKFNVDDDGIAIVLMDVQNQSMNTISTQVSGDLEKIVAKIESDPKIVGAVIGSAKKGSFIAGADIGMISGATSAQDAAEMSVQGQKGMARLENLD